MLEDYSAAEAALGVAIECRSHTPFFDAEFSVVTAHAAWQLLMAQQQAGGRRLVHFHFGAETEVGEVGPLRSHLCRARSRADQDAVLNAPAVSASWTGRCRRPFC